ncbi:hypothetical protein [Allopontixanthobacter sediminis]|uniref:Uncharacterized protein n=1 Tax=Allopontixanthobacter sediminis TaxID=1689985 RepID=A0A845AY51_9SPHN|nr:hypothetical protein [Allopontixanthobacter sediminis]MXP42878.1 hypothetical protein [Allopontixanthobacter sediminis]
MDEWDYESELAEKFEITAEHYWIMGLTLTEARQKALSELNENAGHSARGAGSTPVARHASESLQIALRQ